MWNAPSMAFQSYHVWVWKREIDVKIERIEHENQNLHGSNTSSASHGYTEFDLDSPFNFFDNNKYDGPNDSRKEEEKQSINCNEYMHVYKQC